jgi:pyruvate kinase
MLSAETSIGQFPADAVAAMATIARYTEQHADSAPLAPLLEELRAANRLSHDDEIALSVFRAAEALQPDILLGVTTSGESVRRLARFDLMTWIVAITCREETAQALVFSRGVLPIAGPECAENWARYAVDWLEANGISAKLALLTESTDTRRPRDTAHIEIIHLS